MTLTMWLWWCRVSGTTNPPEGQWPAWGPSLRSHLFSEGSSSLSLFCVFTVFCCLCHDWATLLLFMPLVVLILGLSKEKSVQNGNLELTAEFERIPSAYLPYTTMQTHITFNYWWHRNIYYKTFNPHIYVIHLGKHFCCDLCANLCKYVIFTH